MSKTIYYYQTFLGLQDIMDHVQDVDVIIVSSIHFGKDNSGVKGIYLNDNIPDNSIFEQLWYETEKLSTQGCTIMLMMGGAGGAYTELFSDFDVYYPMLKNFLTNRSWIKGIDLDVEESVNIDNAKKLIQCLVRDFGEDFIITMAPVSPSLQEDGSSMAGFNYKELYTSPEGKHIHWFNTQCYYSFSLETLDSIIKNGYPPHKIVMGMESEQFTKETFPQALKAIKDMKTKYPELAGIYDWEYFNAPPVTKDPSQWAKLIKEC